MPDTNDRKPLRRPKRPLSRSELDRTLDKLETALLRHPADLDPDDGAVWLAVVDDADELRRWLAIGITDPRSALALQNLDVTLSLLEQKRGEVA